MKRSITMMMAMAFLVGCTSCNAQEEVAIPTQEEIPGGETTEKYLSGLTPSDALEYMKTTPGLYIIDVREDEWYEGYTQFDGNVHIPRSQLPTRYTEFPSDRPVILNCGAGVQAPCAYEFLREKNADIKQLSYIAGTPLFAAYNDWLKKKNK